MPKPEPPEERKKTPSQPYKESEGVLKCYAKEITLTICIFQLKYVEVFNAMQSYEIIVIRQSEPPQINKHKNALPDTAKGRAQNRKNQLLNL